MDGKTVEGQRDSHSNLFCPFEGCGDEKYFITTGGLIKHVQSYHSSSRDSPSSSMLKRWLEPRQDSIKRLKVTNGEDI
jgi:hypothetical protein